MVQEYLKAFILIFIAEMGDKTQILAMAFATRFPVKKVLLGIFVGSFLSHGVAVALGSYISNFIPINTIQIVAGFAFVGFSLWTLKLDNEDEEEQKSKLGPVVTVAIAFFIGELGDKTQLTAITLATDAGFPLIILAGTVTGMTVTGAIGILIGKKLGDKVPEFAIKIVAASVFMFFGITKLYQTVPSKFLNLPTVLVFIGALMILVIIMVRAMIARRQQGLESMFLRKSRELNIYYGQVGENLDNICLGVGKCGECQGINCIVGYTKSLVQHGLEDNVPTKQEEFVPSEETLSKDYDKDQALESLIITLEWLVNEPGGIKENETVHEIRKKLEIIVFKKSIEHMENWEGYIKSLMDIDQTSASRIMEGIKK